MLPLQESLSLAGLDEVLSIDFLSFLLSWLPFNDDGEMLCRDEKRNQFLIDSTVRNLYINFGAERSSSSN